MVNNTYKIVELKMCSKQCGFPHRTFVAFAVSENNINLMLFFVLLCHKSHTDSSGKSMPQRTCRKVYTGNMM